jgi:hypothetical protein
MDRSKQIWIAPLLLGAVTITALAFLMRGEEVEQPLVERPAVAVPHEQSEPVIPDVVEAPAAPVSCPGQQLELGLKGQIEIVCMGTLVTKQNGSVRSHQVHTLVAPQRWLRVEVAGSTILSAAWGGSSRPDFYCRAGDCKGIAVGRRDAQGVRVMTLERASLRRIHADGRPSAEAPLLLSGRLEIPPEEPLPALACTGQGLSIVTSDGSSQSFCPKGGAGFEIGDDGNRRYRFSSLDGESILVGVDQNHQVERVEYDGEVSLACRAFECGSVQISTPDSAGARRFTFAGVTLVETSRGESNAVLSGSLILPPL